MESTAQNFRNKGGPIPRGDGTGHGNQKGIIRRLRMAVEKITHQLHVLVGCVVYVGETEACFKGFEQ